MFGNRGFTTWDPWREIARMQAEMDRLVRGETAAAPTGGDDPPIDVWTDEEGLRLRALVPGCVREDLELSVVGDTLTIRGKVPAHALGKGESWHRQERASGGFARTLQLPFAVNADAVVARCKDGVLEVELPRAESEKPRKITVTAG